MKRTMQQSVPSNRSTPYDRNDRGDRGNSRFGNNYMGMGMGNNRNIRGGNNDRRGGISKINIDFYQNIYYYKYCV